MIVLPPYTSDSEAYSKLPMDHRWIMNKLTLAERLGYSCGPCGTNAKPGKYCIRPIMNVLGLARGGFFQVESDVLFRTPMIPGYCWVQWFEGPHVWVQYINDRPVTYSENVVKDGVMSTTVLKETPRAAELVAPALPKALQGISRYMMTESIGDKIIEVSPRLMALNAYQFIIDDYKKVDPSYAPDDGDVQFGNSDLEMQDASWDAGDGQILKGWKWGNPDLNRRT